MSKNRTAPIWNLGAKHSRVSIIQGLAPSGPSTSVHKRNPGKCSKYLFPQNDGSRRTCAPFPLDRFSARRLPALPDLCDRYFKSEQEAANTTSPAPAAPKASLPFVRHHKRLKIKRKERDVGGGAIAYEDDWTFANLTSAAHVGSSAPGTNNIRRSAPLLKHYWNVSGQDRQRIIACAKHNLVMTEAVAEEKPGSNSWRIPANAHPYHCLDYSNDLQSATQRLIRTAEGLQGLTARLEPQAKRIVSSRSTITTA